MKKLIALFLRLPTFEKVDELWEKIRSLEAQSESLIREKERMYCSNNYLNNELERLRREASALSIDNAHLKAEVDKLGQEARLKDSMLLLKSEMGSDMRTMLDIKDKVIASFNSRNTRRK